MREIELISYIKRGKNRRLVFLSLNKPKMPSEMAKEIYGNSSNTNFNLVSRALSELKKKELVTILNPEEKTGRIYNLTQKGKIVKEEIKKYEKTIK